jgi:hypothetical protein
MGHAFAFLCSALAVCRINWVPETTRPTVSFDAEFAAGFVRFSPYGLSARPASRKTVRVLFFTPLRETRPWWQRKVLHSRPNKAMTNHVPKTSHALIASLGGYAGQNQAGESRTKLHEWQTEACPFGVLTLALMAMSLCGDIRYSPNAGGAVSGGSALCRPRMRLASTTRLPGLLFPCGHVTATVLDTSTLSRPRSRQHPLRRPVICPSARCHSAVPHSAVRPRCRPSRPHFCRSAYCRAETVLILPFPLPFLAGTAGWRHLLRPGGTAPLCFPASRDPPGFRVLPKSSAIISPLAAQRLFCDFNHRLAVFKPSFGRRDSTSPLDSV